MISDHSVGIPCTIAESEQESVVDDADDAMNCVAWAPFFPLRGTGRRRPSPRRRARVCSRPRASAGDVNDPDPITGGKTAADFVAPGKTGAEVAANAAAGLSAPAGFGGLLTDSVLEANWRSQRASAASAAAAAAPRPSPPPPLAAPPPAGRDYSQSDPYSAFSAFTRIAAPTAALGEGEDGSPAPAAPATTAAGPTVARALKSPTPYSAGALTRRMLRYFLAQRNLDEFLQFFQGDFDNYAQVASERAAGVLSGEGGGHEHIHCCITQPREGMLFARYYFDGNPSVVFRSRLYRVSVNEKSDRGIVEMRIYRLYADTERLLRAAGYSAQSPAWDDADLCDWLRGCEVFWERYEPGEDDPGKRVLGIDGGTRFVGYMKGGGCELFSNEINAKICVMDDLLLTNEHLWVADRAFDEEGNFVYGNRRGIPYKMRRVTKDGPLAWTLTGGSPPEGYIP